MLSLLRRRKGAVEVLEFKMKVEPFGEEMTHYALYWSKNGGRSWFKLTRGFRPGWASHRLWDLNHPVLFDNFELAVEEAKKYRTLDDVKRHLDVEKAYFDEAYTVEENKLLERKKEWVSA